MNFRDTEEYERILSLIRGTKNYHIKCLFLKHNYETQCKEVRFVVEQHERMLEWMDEVLETYWEDEEVAVFVSVNGDNVLWINEKMCEREHLTILKNMVW